MVFQYSLPKMESLTGDIRHTEHLAVTKDDPSKSLIKQLREDIGDTGAVFVWNKPFEKTRNKKLGTIPAEHAEFFEDLKERVYALGNLSTSGIICIRNLRAAGQSKMF